MSDQHHTAWSELTHALLLLIYDNASSVPREDVDAVLLRASIFNNTQHRVLRFRDVLCQRMRTREVRDTGYTRPNQSPHHYTLDTAGSEDPQRHSKTHPS